MREMVPFSYLKIRNISQQVRLFDESINSFASCLYIYHLIHVVMCMKDHGNLSRYHGYESLDCCDVPHSSHYDQAFSQQVATLSFGYISSWKTCSVFQDFLKTCMVISHTLLIYLRSIFINNSKWIWSGCLGRFRDKWGRSIWGLTSTGCSWFSDNSTWIQSLLCYIPNLWCPYPIRTNVHASATVTFILMGEIMTSSYSLNKYPDIPH